MLIYQENSIKDLELCKEQLALEFLSTEPIIKMLKSLLPTITSALSSTNTLIDVKEYESLNKDQKKFMDLLSHTPFSEIGELRAYVPEGLSEDYITALSVLLPYTKYISQVYADTVYPYSLFLAKLVSDSKEMLSTNSNSVNYKELEKTRNEIYKDVSAIYKNDKESIRLVKRVVQRNADWATVFKLLNECDNNVKTVNRQTLKNTITQCVDYLNVIIENLNKNKSATSSTEVAKRLSEGAYQVAKQVELFTYIYFKVMTMHGSIKNTIDHIHEVYD